MSAEVINCPCGKMIAACAFPHHNHDEEWKASREEYRKQGCSVSVAEDADVKIQFGQCTCPGRNPALAGKNTRWRVPVAYRNRIKMLLFRDGLIWEHSTLYIPIASRQAMAAKYPDSKWELAMPNDAWEYHPGSPSISGMKQAFAHAEPFADPDPTPAP